LGAAEVGMLQALLDREILPDLVVGSSVGALNGVVIAADPTTAAVDRLSETWAQLQARDVFSGSVAKQISNVVHHGNYLHGNEAPRKLIDEAAPGAMIEGLAVRFECVAASIENACAHWFAAGPVVDAVLASCAVPGLLPPGLRRRRTFHGRRARQLGPCGQGLGSRRHPDLRASRRADRAGTASPAPALGRRPCGFRDRSTTTVLGRSV